MCDEIECGCIRGKMRRSSLLYSAPFVLRSAVPQVLRKSVLRSCLPRTPLFSIPKRNLMNIQCGHELIFELPAPAAMLLMLYAHPCRASDLKNPENLSIEPYASIQ